MLLDIRQGDSRPTVLLRSDFSEREACKALPVRRWDAAAKVWQAPVSHIEAIAENFPNADQTQGFRLFHAASALRRSLVRELQALPDLPEGHALRTHLQGVPTPYPHQRVGTAFLTVRQTGLLADEMGLGKSLEAIHALVPRFQRGEISRCVVICPNSVKYVWDHELATHCPALFNDRVLIGGDRDRRAQLLARARLTRWAIINYEAARIEPAALRDLTQGQALICDEAQALKYRQAQISKLVAALRPACLFLLTGTPVANRPEDLWHLANLVEPGLLGDFWRFCERYCVKDFFGAIRSYRRLDELHARVSHLYLRRRKADVLHLPLKTTSLVPIELGPEETAAYASMKELLFASLADKDDHYVRTHAPTILTQLLRLSEIADGMVRQGDDVAIVDIPAKTQALDELVSATDGKLVIWTRFRPVAQYLADRYSAPAYTGDLSPERRNEVVDAFQTCDEPRILVATIQAAGLGLTLTAAQTQVFYDRWWSPAVNLQAEDRLHRIGQTGTVNIYHLVARQTIDEHLSVLLQRKQAWAHRILADPHDSPEVHAPALTRAAALSLLR